MRDEEKYYTLYEDRYRRIYAQGIQYWSADPEEKARVVNSIEKFLHCYWRQPSTTSIIEFGCGEGYLAGYLLGYGYRYLGVDLSESAILKAKERIGTKGADAFLLADITDLHQIPDGF